MTGTALPMLAIVWHSRTGTAAAMAREALAGAAGNAGCTAHLFPAAEATADVLLAAHGYLFICPENLGAMSGAMKEMFDRAYYPLLGRVEGRPYATAIAAGSDGHAAQAQIDRIATGWRLRRVAEPIICNTGAQTAAAIQAPKRLALSQAATMRSLGALLAEGIGVGIF